jgi:hypothetical protein
MQLAVVGLAVVGSSGAGAQRAGLSAPLPLLTHLSLAARIDYDSATVAGTATLTLRNGSSRVMRQVPLLLNRLMQVRRARDDVGRTALFTQRVATFTDVRTF